MTGLSHMSTPRVGKNFTGITLPENEEEGFHKGNSVLSYEIKLGMVSE